MNKFTKDGVLDALKDRGLRLKDITTWNVSEEAANALLTLGFLDDMNDNSTPFVTFHGKTITIWTAEQRFHSNKRLTIDPSARDLVDEADLVN